MGWIRKTIAGFALGVAVAALAFVPLASAASKAQQAKFVKAVHRIAPATKKVSNKKLISLGTATCNILKFAPINDEVSVLEEPTNTFHFPKNQVVPILSTVVTYLCPSHASAMERYENTGGGSAPKAAPTTTTTPAPPTAAFNCTGSAPDGVDITYGTDSINDDGNGALPWSASLALPSDAEYADVQAQLSGSGSVTCTTTVTWDGHSVTKTGAANGGYNIASAQICSSFDGGWETC